MDFGNHGFLYLGVWVCVSKNESLLDTCIPAAIETLVYVQEHFQVLVFRLLRLLRSLTSLLIYLTSYLTRVTSLGKEQERQAWDKFPSTMPVLASSNNF